MILIIFYAGLSGFFCTMLAELVIADGQFLTRTGLQGVLDQELTFSVTATAGNSLELLNALEEHPPDVLLIDPADPEHFDISDLEAVSEVSPETRLMVISDESNRQRITKILDAGVKCFVTKQCSKEEIIQGIHACTRDEKFFCNKVLEILLERKVGPEIDDCDPTDLSDREWEIVQQIARGHTNKQIAEALFLSYHTVNTHRKNIYRKLGIHSPAELVRVAMDQGMVNGV